MLRHIQTTIGSGQGRMPERGWEVPVREQGCRSEEALDWRFRSNSRNVFPRFPNGNEDLESTHDVVRGNNESPNLDPEYLTEQIPSRTALIQPACDNIDLLDTTLAATEETSPMAVQDPNDRLADVLTKLQNRLTAQPQFTMRPVNSNTMNYDGKSEKCEQFEDLFHTMIKKQPEMSDEMEINHFHSLLRKAALQTFRNINTDDRPTKDVLVIFRPKNVKPDSQATAKQKWHGLVFNPNTMKLPHYLGELNQAAQKAFGENAQKLTDSILYAKLLPKLKRSVKMA